MMKFTKEESTFVEQLQSVRKAIAMLQIEEATQVDRILTILRGHQVNTAFTHDSRITITRVVKDSMEHVQLDGVSW